MDKKNYQVTIASTILQAVLFTLLLIISTANACTVFSFTKDDTMIVAKNLDWPVSQGFICINNRNIYKNTTFSDSINSFQWKSVYGSITFNQFGPGYPISGMNEKGLVIEETAYSLSSFPNLTNVPGINEFQWVQYFLDTKQSVNEVIEAVNEVNIVPILIGLHYFICDSSGNYAMIEYLDEDVKIWRKETIPYPVLTNNSFQNSLKYLSYHVGFGGEMEIRNGPESPVRFVKAVSILDSIDHTKEHSFNLENSIFDILNSVRQYDTQWQIVYFPGEKTLIFKYLPDKKKEFLNLNTFTFKADRTFVKAISTDEDFKVYTVEEYSYMLLNIINEYFNKDILEKTQGEKIYQDIMNNIRHAETLRE